MTVRRAGLLHGAVVDAPDEGAFVVSESPLPPKVLPRRVDAEREPSRALNVAWTLLKLVVGLSIVVGAAFGVAWGAHRYAVTTPRFAIRSFDLTGARRTTIAQIQGRTGLALGHNMFAIDLPATEARLLEEPFIREVKLTRQLPNTLRIEVIEHEAGAIASLEGKLYLLSRLGEPFKELAADDSFDLPVVTGVSAADLARDRQGSVARWAVALDVVRQYERIATSKIHPAEEVHLARSGDVVLIVGSSGVALYLGKGPWRSKLLMAARVFEQLAAKGRVPDIVFLDNQAHPERVVVRMR